MSLSFKRVVSGRRWSCAELPEVSMVKVSFGYKPWRFEVASNDSPLAFLRVREFASRADAEACLLEEAGRLK